MNQGSNIVLFPLSRPPGSGQHGERAPFDEVDLGFTLSLLDAHMKSSDFNIPRWLSSIGCCHRTDSLYVVQLNIDRYGLEVVVSALVPHRLCTTILNRLPTAQAPNSSRVRNRPKCPEYRSF